MKEITSYNRAVQYMSKVFKMVNKEYFGIVDKFLMRWKFDFWAVKWVKGLILVGFDDKGYDKG